MVIRKIKNKKSKIKNLSRTFQQGLIPRWKVRDKCIYIFFILFICTQITAVFAQDAEFNASVDKNSVPMDDYVELTLTVTGVQDSGTPQLPKLEGFKIISSGSSSQFSFINGKMSSSRTFTYLLMPLKEGKLTIPPAAVEADGKKLETNPIDIEVVKGGGSMPAPSKPSAQVPAEEEEAETQPVPAPGLKERVFIKVETDKNTAYIGEQITMTFKLYHGGVMIDNLQYTPPVTKGFVTESMGEQRQYKEVVNGVVYNVVELKTAIFPAREGELTVDPARLKCDLLVREQIPRRRHSRYDDFFDDFFQDSFFNNYKRCPTELESEPVNINVKQLPLENRPDTFRGTVGTYDMNIEAAPLSLKAGEPINLVMKISGAGNITQISEPVIKNLSGFKAYDSEIKNGISGRDPQIAGQKVFQKVIIPQDEKVKEIPVIEFSYFDPVLNQYKIIKKGPIPITVAPAPRKEAEIVEFVKQIGPSEETKKAVRFLAKDIQYIQKSSGRFSRIGEYWYKNILFWILILLVPIPVPCILLIYNLHKTRLEEDVAYAKARGAHRIAKGLLAEALNYQKQNKPKEFYDSIAKAVQKFMGDRMNIPVGSVTGANLEGLLVSKGIKTETISLIREMLDKCDMVRFGAQSADQAEMKQVMKEVNSIINILTKRL